MGKCSEDPRILCGQGLIPLMNVVNVTTIKGHHLSCQNRTSEFDDEAATTD